MNENKKALEDAGFTQFQSMNWLYLINEGAFEQINISQDTLQINIYKNKEDSHAIHVVIAKDLEDVKKILYGFLGYHLDFTAKPKYDWETAKKYYGQNQRDSIFNAIYWIEQMYNQGTITQAESLSMIAKIKLNIIIQQIDKDYPKEEEGFWGCIHLSHRGRGNPVEMKAYETTDPKEWSMITECVQGAQILLDQNPQLLKNFFKIETDA